MNDFLKEFFPELGWTKFTPDERELLLGNLDGFGMQGPLTADFIRGHSLACGYFPQAYSGAGWTLLGNLIVPPRTDLNDKRILAVIIHEVLHLQQSLVTRLSVYGELLAWQLEYRVYHEVTGNYYGQKGLPFDGSAAQWQQIAQLSAEVYEDLARAQSLMREVAPTYRSNRLPLYPLGRELRYRISKRFERPGARAV